MLFAGRVGQRATSMYQTSLPSFSCRTLQYLVVGSAHCGNMHLRNNPLSNLQNLVHVLCCRVDAIVRCTKQSRSNLACSLVVSPRATSELHGAHLVKVG